MAGDIGSKQQREMTMGREPDDHGTVRQEITALPATPGNIAKANVTVPAGFRKVPSSTFGDPVWPYFTSG